MSQTAASPVPARAVRALEASDFESWLALWLANNNGQCDPAVTETTWRRLMDPASPVKGLAALQDGKMAGLVHYILHPVTGHINPACYMQDLYVDTAARQRGLGRALVESLAALGRREKWARMYWLAEESNPQAQALYKHLGLRLAFSFHVMPLT